MFRNGQHKKVENNAPDFDIYRVSIPSYRDSFILHSRDRIQSC